MSQELVAQRQAALNALVSEHRVALPGAIWSRVLDILQVPADRREADAHELSSILTLGVVFYGNNITPREIAAVRADLAETSAMATALVNQLLSYDIAACVAFEFNAVGLDVGRDPSSAPSAAARFLDDTIALRFARLRRAIRAAADIAVTAADFSASRVVSCPRELAFPLCVALLLRAGFERGWRVTFSPNTESGPLVEILDQLRPHMPDGFIPDPLSMKQLRRIQRSARETP